MLVFQAGGSALKQKIKSDYGFRDVPPSVENAANLQNSYIATYTGSSGKPYHRFVLKNDEGEIFDYRLHKKVSAGDLQNADFWLSEEEWKGLIGKNYSFEFTPISQLKISLNDEPKKQKETVKKSKETASSQEIVAAFENEIRDRPLHHKYYEYLAEIVESREKFSEILGKYRGLWSHIEDAAREFDLDPVLVCAIIYAESVLGKHMESSADAYGYMQVKKSTAQFMEGTFGDKFSQEDVENFKESKENIRFGSCYFRMMLDQFGQPDLASLAYNAGPGAAEKKLKGQRGFVSDNYIYVQAVYTYYKFFKSFDLGNASLPVVNTDYYYQLALSEFNNNLAGSKSDTYLSGFDFKKDASYKSP